jgi:hypothetical protein
MDLDFGEISGRDFHAAAVVAIMNISMAQGNEPHRHRGRPGRTLVFAGTRVQW